VQPVVDDTAEELIAQFVQPKQDRRVDVALFRLKPGERKRGDRMTKN
jgi:hypothetical protein